MSHDIPKKPGKKRILVTGGAGYIGSHTCVELLLAGFEVVVADNLSNSKEEALRRVQEITHQSLVFYKLDLMDRQALRAVLRSASIDAVIHFTGLKAVGESITLPLRYYQNNITGTLTLLEEMERNGIENIIFSSSATVYGDERYLTAAQIADLAMYPSASRM